MQSESSSNRSPLLARLLVALCAFAIGFGCAFAFIKSGAAGKADAPATDAAQADAPEAAASPEDTRAILASWDTESEAYKQLTAFVEDVCDEGSESYLPPEERVATTDMDGTFICERGPIYIDQTFACWRILDDPTYEAPAGLKADVESVIDEVRSGVVPESVDLNAVLSMSYAGYTPEELEDDVVRFATNNDVLGFSGMKYSESFYKPMVEVIEYLRANDFEVYVVSACERYVSRALSVNFVGFDPSHVVGTDLEVGASGQGDEEGLDYTFDQKDELDIVGDRILETGKTNKVIAIQNEIGRRPVLAFGNSSGDFAMLNYATANPDHKGLGFLVIADDVEREYGNEEKAASMRDEVSKEGWVGISMRDDWKTIYGDGVERTELPQVEELAEAA